MPPIEPWWMSREAPGAGLLSLANSGKNGDTPDSVIPKISQDTVAEMALDSNGDLRVDKSLLSLLLNDQPALERLTKSQD